MNSGDYRNKAYIWKTFDTKTLGNILVSKKMFYALARKNKEPASIKELRNEIKIIKSILRKRREQK